eukprot:4983665-Prymnesium_polylepis.1
MGARAAARLRHGRHLVAVLLGELAKLGVPPPEGHSHEQVEPLGQGEPAADLGHVALGRGRVGLAEGRLHVGGRVEGRLEPHVHHKVDKLVVVHALPLLGRLVSRRVAVRAEDRAQLDKVRLQQAEHVRLPRGEAVDAGQLDGRP